MSINILSPYAPVLILSIGIFALPALAHTDPAAVQYSGAAPPTEGAICANYLLRALDSLLTPRCGMEPARPKTSAIASAPGSL